MQTPFQRLLCFTGLLAAAAAIVAPGTIAAAQRYPGATQLQAARVAAAAPLGPSALGASPPPPEPTCPPTCPIPQSVLDGCQRDPGALLTKRSPEWVYIYNTPAAQPPPPPQTVVGTISAFNTRYQAVHTAGGDLPMGHSAYDFNVNVLPDAGYTFLMAGHDDPDPTKRTGNYPGNGEETRRLHTEWEDLSVPKFAWGAPGDRITEVGHWVWDCGHWGTSSTYDSPDYILPKAGQPCVGIPDPTQCSLTGESSEFHPYLALWLERAKSPSSALGESESDLFISTHKTKAGIEADCAHKNPAPTTPPGSPYPPGYAACLNTEPDWQDVTGDYSFLLPAPPKPSPTAALTFRQVDRGSGPGTPVPTLAAEGNGLRVTFHVDSPLSQERIMAYQFFAGWTEPPATGLPTHLHVSLDNLLVHRAMDPGCTTDAFGAPLPCTDAIKAESTRANQATTPPGDWNLYYDVSGVWGQWQPNGQASGEFLPNDGSTYQGTQSVELYVPQGQGWRLFVHGRECDLGSLGVQLDCPTNNELADNNDVQGMILDAYPSATASLGTHTSNGMTAKDDPTSTCPDVNPQGCYSLTYTVSLVQTGPGVPETPVAAGLVGVSLAGLGMVELVRRRRLRSATRSQHSS